MAKVATPAQGNVGTIRRKCLICGERWDASHPNDPNTLFCPMCEQALRELIEERRNSELGMVRTDAADNALYSNERR